MKVYKCLITGDEFFSDIYPITDKDGLLKIKGKLITRAVGDNIDDSLIGGNASAEEPQETGGEESKESGCNVVLDNRLQPTSFGTKKEFTAYFKDYVKALEEKKKESAPDADYDAWRKEITNSFKLALADFKEYEFFTGASGDPDGAIAFLKWETPEGETDEVPYVIMFKESLKEEKC